MANPTELNDPFVKTSLLEAEEALDAGDYLETVRKCVEVSPPCRSAPRSRSQAAKPIR